MPYHGRDTYYLEHMIASVSLMMAILCGFYGDRVASLSFLSSPAVNSPVWLWAIFWLISAILIYSGKALKSNRLSQHAAMWTACLWGVVFYASVTSKLLFPMSFAVSPCFILWSAMVYVYRSRIERWRNHGRSTAER